MAKKADNEQGVNQDVNELVNFQDAWDTEEPKDIRDVTTRKGRLRGSMSPKARVRGIEILRQFGL